MSNTDTTSSDHPIRRLYEQILIAWNEQDAVAMAACFEEDGNLVGYDGSQADSRSTIEDHLRPIFADHPTAAYVAKVREIRMLSSNVGILRAVVGMIPPNSEDVNPAGNTIQTLAAVQNADRWRANCAPGGVSVVLTSRRIRATPWLASSTYRSQSVTSRDSIIGTARASSNTSLPSALCWEMEAESYTRFKGG
jgi:uncharacterized protein (TIGR02246 family)